MSHKRLLFSLIVLSIVCYYANSAVIGIDFGNEFFKVSLISPGKSFVIIENTVSKRKTPSTISFMEDERLYEYDALGKRARNPQNTFVFLQKFLGAFASDEHVFTASKENFEDYLITFDENRKTVLFELSNFKFEDSEGENVKLSVEEVVAMIFRHARRLAEKQSKVQIKDCVITVPSDWSLNQRRALVDAATLSGLTTLALVHENTAAALYYGINRLDENKTHTVLFYNMGSDCLQVSLVEYNTVNSTEKDKKPIESIRVLADKVERGISGMGFDRVLADHFAEEFDKSPKRKEKESIRKSSPTMIKLLKECNKFKETLSANKEASLYIENLSDGDDFKGHLSRSVFEDKSRKMLDLVTSPIDYVLQAAGRTLEDVDVLEIIGGSVRIPKIQQILTKYLSGKELGAHLNGDESMAFGAAFLAANLSHSFRVRPVLLYDGYNFHVNLSLKNLRSEDEPYEKNVIIFPFKQRFKSKKVISISHDRDLQATLTAVYRDGTVEPLTTINFTNISLIANDEKYKNLSKPKIQLQFVVSSTYPTIEIESAEAILEEIKLIEVEEPKKAGRKKKVENNTSADNQTSDAANTTNSSQNENPKSEAEQTEDSSKPQESQDKSANEEEPKNEEPKSETESEEVKNKESSASKENEEKTAGESTDSTPKEENAKSTDNSSNQSSTSETPPKRYKNRTITHTLTLSREVFHFGLQPLNETEIKNSSKKLKKFDRLEESKKKLAEAKNRLEAFIYKTREYLEDEEFKKFSSAEEKGDLERFATEYDEWLYSDEAGAANHTEFKKRYNRMNNIAQDVTSRIEENKKSPEAIKEGKKKLEDYEKKVGELNKTMPWVNETVKSNLLEEIKSTRDWIKQKVEENLNPLYETRKYTVSQLDHQLNLIKDAYNNIKNIKKPKEKKSKKKSNETNTTNATKSEEEPASDAGTSKAEDTPSSESSTPTKEGADTSKPKEEKNYNREYKDDDKGGSSSTSQNKKKKKNKKEQKEDL